MTAVLDAPVVRPGAAAAPATGARRLLADPGAVDAVCAALSVLHTDPAAARAVPVVLAATDYCVYAADRFAARRDDPARRLRPSDSVALEGAGLLQEFSATTGWQGPGYVLSDPVGDGGAALRFARGLVGCGRADAVYVCEVLRADDGTFWAVATRVRPAGPDAEPSPLGPRPAELDAATWERSAVLGAYARRPATPNAFAEEQS